MVKSVPKSSPAWMASKSRTPPSRREHLPTSQPNHTGWPSCIWAMAAAFKSSTGKFKYLTGRPSTTLPSSFTV